MGNEFDDEEIIEPEVPAVDEPIQVDVKRTVNVSIKARKKVGDRTVVVNSLKSGIRITLKRVGHWDDGLLIPNALVDTVGEVFTAIREAKQKEEEANG